MNVMTKLCVRTPAPHAPITIRVMDSARTVAGVLTCLIQAAAHTLVFATQTIVLTAMKKRVAQTATASGILTRINVTMQRQDFLIGCCI